MWRLESFLDALDLNRITLVRQDRGGFIGLRAGADMPARFARIVAANTALPEAQGIDDAAAKTISERVRVYYEGLPVHRSAAEMGAAMRADATGMGFLHWVKFCAQTPVLEVSEVAGFNSREGLSDKAARAYDAPFPDDRHMAGGRQLPSLVPIMPDNPAIAANRAV